MMRIVVVLPQPDGPTNTMNSPSAAVEREVLDRDDVAEAFPNLTELNSCHSNSPWRRSSCLVIASRRRNAPDEQALVGSVRRAVERQASIDAKSLLDGGRCCK